MQKQRDLKMQVLKIGAPKDAGARKLEETSNEFVLRAPGISEALSTPWFHPNDIYFGLLASRDSERLDSYYLLFPVCSSLSWQFPEN